MLIPPKQTPLRVHSDAAVNNLPETNTKSKRQATTVAAIVGSPTRVGTTVGIGRLGYLGCGRIAYRGLN
jgi:hypothetical protein